MSPIIADTDDLLGPTLDAVAVVDGLGDPTNNLVNGLLESLDLSPRDKNPIVVDTNDLLGLDVVVKVDGLGDLLNNLVNGLELGDTVDNLVNGILADLDLGGPPSTGANATGGILVNVDALLNLGDILASVVINLGGGSGSGPAPPHPSSSSPHPASSSHPAAPSPSHVPGSGNGSLQDIIDLTLAIVATLTVDLGKDLNSCYGLIPLTDALLAALNAYLKVGGLDATTVTTVKGLINTTNGLVAVVDGILAGLNACLCKDDEELMEAVRALVANCWMSKN